MKVYLQNLLARLSEFSSTLDKKENFIDIPWVIIDEESNHQKIIFKRDGNLIMSLEGKVTIGKWEYLPYAKSLLLDRVKDKILLNQAFVNQAVMALKLDGSSNDYMLLANEILIPDLDILNYLKHIYYDQYGIKTIDLTNGQQLEVKSITGQDNYHDVTIDFEPVPDGSLITVNKEKLIIQNSKIRRILVWVEYKTNRGTVLIEHLKDFYPENGDIVIKDGRPAPDGKYRCGFLSFFWVKDGHIVKA